MHYEKISKKVLAIPLQQHVMRKPFLWIISFLGQSLVRYVQIIRVVMLNLYTNHYFRSLQVMVLTTLFRLPDISRRMCHCMKMRTDLNYF